MAIVLIRDVETGQEVRWEDHHSVEADMVYYRDEGGSCDCNRELNFRRALGWNEDAIWEAETGFCAGRGRYAVKVLDEAGNVAYEDDGHPR